VRTLIGVLVAIAALGIVVEGARYATGMQPLSFGSWSSTPKGLPPIKSTDDTYDTGPTVYKWRPGGTYRLTFDVHNSASVALTITGVGHSAGYWEGANAGPTLANANPNFEPVPGPFRPVRLGPDESKPISFVFHANPKSICGTGVYSVDAVIVHFTTFSVVHDTQALPLGDAAFYITHRC